MSRREATATSPIDAPSADAGHRDPDDDFFCLRYAVWYASFDCAIRTRFRTAAGCLGCEQGRFNLHRHRPALRTMRWSGPVADEP